MKIFANKSIWKKIVIIFLLIISISFVAPKPAQASVGGELMEPVCDLIVGLGDGIIGVLHDIVLGQDMTMVKINLYDFWNSPLIKGIAVILGFLIVAALIALGAGVIGAAFVALGDAIAAGSVGGVTFGVGAAISKALGTILVLSIGGGVYAGAKIYSADGWRDKQLDLPLYSISPEEIFSNKIPLFDVNFFNPDESKEWKYDFAMHFDITDEIKNAEYRTLVSSRNKSGSK